MKFNPTTGKLDTSTSPDLSKLVPYSGATTDVNLGVYGVTSSSVQIQTAAGKMSLYEAAGRMWLLSNSNTGMQINAKTLAGGALSYIDMNSSGDLNLFSQSKNGLSMYGRLNRLDLGLSGWTVYVEGFLDVISNAYFHSSITCSSASIGDSTNNTLFQTDGTMVAQGDATCYRDELNDLLKTGKNNPSDHIVTNLTDGTLDFKNNCNLGDWALMNIQVNHDWKLGTAIEPHLHWFQNATQTPNWLIQYRWQRQLQPITTAWTSVTWSTNAISWSTGVINQITSFGSIEPPSGYGQVSDIVQIKLFRDTGNASTLFGGADTYTGSASTTSFDIHIQVDMLGSRQQYVK